VVTVNGQLAVVAGALAELTDLADAAAAPAGRQV